MTILAALISLGCSYVDARPVAQHIPAAARRYRIDPLLLAAVVAHETRCVNVVARGRGKGRRGCDVGVAQIHVPGCEIHAAMRFLARAEGLTRAAVLSRGA